MRSQGAHRLSEIGNKALAHRKPSWLESRNTDMDKKPASPQAPGGANALYNAAFTRRHHPGRGYPGLDRPGGPAHPQLPQGIAWPSSRSPAGRNPVTDAL